MEKSWQTKKMSDVVDILDNLRKPVNSDERAKRIGEIPYYGATGQTGTIDDFIFNEELVLLGEDGAPFFDKTKNVAYIINGKSWVNNHAHVLRAKSEITNNHFLFYFLNQFNYNGYVSGTTRLKLNQKTLKEIPIPLPPLPEQERIVAKLDTLFAHLEQTKKRLEQIPVLLKQFRQAVLTQAVTGKLTEECVELSSFDIKIKTGPFGSSVHKSDYITNGIPLINPSHIVNGQIVPDNSISVNNVKAHELSQFKLNNNDVILGRRGEMGRVAVYKESLGEMLCGTGSIILISGEQINSEYLAMYLRSPFCVNFLNENSIGSTMVNLNQKILKALPFPNISFNEQTEIVRRVESLFAKADALEARYKVLKEMVDKLPQAILGKAFRGEV